MGFPGMDVMCTRLTGYFLTSSVFIVVEAASACKLLLQMCKLLSFHGARERRDEARRDDEHRRRNAASTSLSGEFQQLYNTIYQRISSLTWVLIQISRPPCTHSKFHPTHGVKFVPDAVTKIFQPIAYFVFSFAL